MHLDTEQRQIAARVAAAGALILLTALLVRESGWRPFNFGSGPLERLGFGLACLFPVTLCLAAAIGAQACQRFMDGRHRPGPKSPRAGKLVSLIQNTVEQTVLAIPAYLGGALLLPEPWLGTVGAAAVLFVIGRLAFARGLNEGAAGRAFGFALTFLPTLALLGANIILVAS